MSGVRAHKSHVWMVNVGWLPRGSFTFWVLTAHQRMARRPNLGGIVEWADDGIGNQAAALICTGVGYWRRHRRGFHPEAGQPEMLSFGEPVVLNFRALRSFAPIWRFRYTRLRREVGRGHCWRCVTAVVRQPESLDPAQSSSTRCGAVDALHVAWLRSRAYCAL